MSSSSPSELADEVSDVLTSVRTQKKEISEFQSFLEEAEARISKLEPNKRQAFYESVDDLRTKVENVDNVESLLDLKGEIEEAIKSPLKEAALDSFDDFINEVGADLDNDDESELRKSIQNSIQSDLEDMAETYQNLTEVVTDYPPRLKVLIANWIEEQPSIVTTNRADLSDNIIELESRHSNLSTIQSDLDGVAWGPSEDLTENDRFYNELGYSIPVESIQEDISAIGENVDELESSQLSVVDPVQNKLEEELATATAEDLSSVFNSLDRKVDTLSFNFGNVQGFADAVESFGRNRGIFESEIDELLADTEHIKINSYSSVSAVTDEVNQLESEYKAFFETVSERLGAQREMVEDLNNEFEELDPPSVDDEIASEESLTRIVISSNPLIALEASVTYDSWLKDGFEAIEGTFETDTAMQIWEQLYEGESVELTEENEDEIIALSGRFTLNVVLGSE